jgi:hypothetical protein
VRNDRGQRRGWSVISAWTCELTTEKRKKLSAELVLSERSESNGSVCSEWLSLCGLLSPVIGQGQIVLPDVPVPVFLAIAL